MINYNGYTAEEYDVITEDGYILTVFVASRSYQISISDSRGARVQPDHYRSLTLEFEDSSFSFGVFSSTTRILRGTYRRTLY